MIQLTSGKSLQHVTAEAETLARQRHTLSLFAADNEGATFPDYTRPFESYEEAFQALSVFHYVHSEKPQTSESLTAEQRKIVDGFYQRINDIESRYRELFDRVYVKPTDDSHLLNKFAVLDEKAELEKEKASFNALTKQVQLQSYSSFPRT